MSGRRTLNNRIRGPQSALTDFLASNNISAAQIRDDYERRQRSAQQQAPSETGPDPDEQHGGPDEPAESTEQSKKRKRREAKAIAKIKETKEFKRRQRYKDGEPDDDDEVAWDMYKKAKPLPGQLENCELCNKRFTVTGYSKEGPDGGLLCPKCSKELEAEKKNDKPKKRATPRDKRRQTQSNLLDGIISNGAKSLQELCVAKVADNINDIDEFGDLPQSLLLRLSQILSKRRVLDSRTLDLFLRPDLDSVAIYDCGKLEMDDYKRIFAIVPNVETLFLYNAGQFKNDVMMYALERNVPIKHLQLHAANLISNETWHELFFHQGEQLETLKLAWLDFSLEDHSVTSMVKYCPNIKRLKLEKCFKLGDEAVESLSGLRKLDHLSLSLIRPIATKSLCSVIHSVGANLKTLCLDRFEDADNSVLRALHGHCGRLVKFRFTENDRCTDSGFVELFTKWSNPPLVSVNLSSNRDVDYKNPDGPDEPTGLASKGLHALMRHSGQSLEKLDISSCRHISHETFLDIFDGSRVFPNLREFNISFLTRIDTPIVAGIFKSCPRMVKLTAFGCFNVKDVLVPPGVALIGLPNAQESIIVEGEV